MMTQKNRILEHLVKYGSITTWQSFELYGDTRLSDKIFKLKKEGYSFDEEWIYKMNRYGKKIKFKKYILK